MRQRRGKLRPQDSCPQDSRRARPLAALSNWCVFGLAVAGFVLFCIFVRRLSDYASHQEGAQVPRGDLDGVDARFEELSFKGFEAFEQKSFAKAVQLFAAASKLRPGLGAAYGNLGLALLEKGQIDKSQILIGDAAAVLKHAVHLDPSRASVWTNYANALAKLGMHSNDAEQAYRSAIAVDPTRVFPYSGLGRLLFDANKLEQSREMYRQAVRIKPGESSLLISLADVSAALGDWTAAAALYQRVMEQEPQNLRALKATAYAAFKTGDSGRSEMLFERAISLSPLDGETKHLMSAILGESPAFASHDYVEQLFDNMAARFDLHLQSLQYEAPRRLVQALVTAARAHGLTPLRRVLDLGCGTGLAGLELRSTSRVEHLEGVDLSAKMLDKARGRRPQVYNATHQAGVVEFLRKHHFETSWDMAIAADTIPYFGDLQPLFSAAAATISLGGLLGLNTEDMPQEEGSGKQYILRSTGRYVHSPAYVESTAAGAGFQLVTMQRFASRREAGAAVSSTLFVFAMHST